MQSGSARQNVRPELQDLYSFDCEAPAPIATSAVVRIGGLRVGVERGKERLVGVACEGRKERFSAVPHSVSADGRSCDRTAETAIAITFRPLLCRRFEGDLVQISLKPRNWVRYTGARRRTAHRRAIGTSQSERIPFIGIPGELDESVQRTPLGLLE
eukprot:jgi/Botrbrau1/5797/Bobra.0155s0020.1